MAGVLICYLTYSGNTQEVAEIIKDTLEFDNIDVDLYEIGFGSIPDLSRYKAVLIGTFTWDQGATPGEVKDFVADVGYKPDDIYVFGSGDTQFGGDSLFCKAVDKLTKFYDSQIEGLKIEQSPRGSQEEFVREWTRKVMNKVFN